MYYIFFMQNKKLLFAIIFCALAFFQTVQAERITFATWNIRFANAEDFRLFSEKKEIVLL